MAGIDRADMGGRGPIAVEDMKNRIADGWTVSELWDRLQAAWTGDGFSYEYAERVPLEDLERAHVGGDA